MKALTLTGTLRRLAAATALIASASAMLALPAHGLTTISQTGSVG